MALDLLTQPGLPWLVAAAALAGLVRGFAGFGSALVFMPVAGEVLFPVPALTVLLAMDVIGPVANVPAALRAADRRDLGRIVAGMFVGLPAGLVVLGWMDPLLFRYLVCALSFGTLALLASGMRYRGPMGTPLLIGTGAAGGILGGIAGMAGPPVILLYMSTRKGVAAIRANLLLYLVAVDVAMLVLLALWGWLEVPAFLLGLLLAIPYLLANVAGAAMFSPERSGLYRAVAYAIIAASALTGLPLWD